MKNSTKCRAIPLRPSEHSPSSSPVPGKLVPVIPPLLSHPTLKVTSRNAAKTVPSSGAAEVSAGTRARTERLLRAANSERYLPSSHVSWRAVGQPRRAEGSSCSSSGTRDDSKSRAKTAAEGASRNATEGELASLPKAMSMSAAVGKPRESARKVKPIVISAVDVGSSVDSGTALNSERAKMYASVQGGAGSNSMVYQTQGPRSSESMCQRLFQGGLTRRIRCNYFQIKTGKFVSPKIVRASRRYVPKTGGDKHPSMLETHGTLLTRAKEQRSPPLASLTPRGKKTIPVLGATDKSQSKREDIKRIFKLDAFKNRVASDLFLDDYRKRMPLRVAEMLSGSPRELRVVPRTSHVSSAALRSSSAASFFPTGHDSFSGSFSILQRSQFDCSCDSAYSSVRGGRARKTATSLLLKKLEDEVIAQREEKKASSDNIQVVEDYVVADADAGGK